MALPPDTPLEGEDTQKTASTLDGERSVKAGAEYYYRIIIIVLAVSVTMPLVLKNRSSRLKPAAPVFYSASPDSALVWVGGDVRHPGVYSATATTMTIGVIKMAEPLRAIRGCLPKGEEQVAVNSGNLYKISINKEGYARIIKEEIPAAQRILLRIPLNINSMEAADFELLPGIGPVMSRKIVEYRHKNGGFMKISDLMKIDGIGEKKYEQLEKIFKPLKEQKKIYYNQR